MAKFASAFLLVLATLQATCAQRLDVRASDSGWSFMQYKTSPAKQVTGTARVPPTDQPNLPIWRWFHAQGGEAQFKYDADLFSVTNYQKFENLVLYFKTEPGGTPETSSNETIANINLVVGQNYSPLAWNTLQIQFELFYTYDPNNPNPKTPYQLLNNIATIEGGATTFANNGWVKFVIPMSKFEQKNWNLIKINYFGAPNAVIQMGGFFGFPDGQSRAVYPPDAPFPDIPADYQFVTYRKSLQLQNGDMNLTSQWICGHRLPATPMPELSGVAIHAYRDTNYGIPVPMDLSTAGWNAADKTWTVQDMWYGTLKADGYYYPHPALICSLHNADFFEIGDVKGLGENNTLYVWVPELRYDLMHVIAAYATYVKKTRDLDGKDTVAFHIRTRPDPKYGSEWEFLRNAPLICENDQPKYLCPDHILFKDSQMGLVHNGRDLLHPLSELEQAYFKDNAYLATMDIYPLIQKLTVYSEVNYAIPFAVYFEPWLVNKKTLSDLGLTMPPNGPNSALWGGAWWETWNIKKLNEYLKKMKDAGLSNLLPLPAEIDGVTWETKLATYLGFSYGASVLNPAGRCGLDANMEKALNETIVSWRENTDWEHKTQTSGYFNTGGGTGILPWRGIYGGSDEFLKWMDAEPLEDPLKEPRFIFGAANDKVHDDTVQLTTTQPGFGFDKMYDPDGKWNTYTRIYPPTGSAFIGAKLLGIAKSSRNKTRAFEVLMGAFSRNSRHHVNCPSILKNNYGGISGYLTAKYATGFAETGKSFYDGLIEHAMFVGTPVAQSFAYGEMEKYNPMQVAFNEILYKRKPVNESLERACKIINYYTKPPCTMDDMEAYLEDVPGTNKATLKYRYIEPDQEKRDCNVKLPNSKKIPEPIVGALPTQFVSTQSNISVAMVGLAAAAMVIEFILIVLFAVKRDAPVIRAASRIFSNLILLGGMLTLASVIIRTSRNGELGWLQCFGTYWFFAIGFGLVLGSLLVKTYRVDRIFRNKNPGFRLSDFQLVCYIAVIVFFEVIFLLVLQFYLDDPNYSTQRTIPLSDITVSQYSCPKSNKLGPILLYVWNALIIFLAGLYAFRTRNVASTFNENIFTVAAISLISIISIVIVPVISIIESPSAIFLMISLGTIFGTILSVLVFAVPKLAVAFEIFSFGDAMAAMTTTIKRHGSGSGSGSGTMSPGRTNVVKSQASDTKGQFSFVGPTSSRDNRRGSGQMIGNTSKIAKTGPNNV